MKDFKNLIQKIPKSDIHLHLDGSIRLDTIIDLAKEQKIKLPSYTASGLEETLFKDHYNSLDEYLKTFGYSCSVMQTPESLERIAYELAIDCQEEGIKYIEVRMDPLLVTNSLQSHLDVFKLIDRGLKKANVQMIQAFGTTVEKRDPYTAGHQFRVSNLAEAIAKQMKLEKHFIESVKLSALIHDIGKIGVAKSLLTKKKRLSDDEFQKIKNHVSIGYDIVKNLDIEQEIKDGILHHHERLDGSGYPLGIKKEQISLIGKILAVADTVEAIANARPYRTALGLGEAIKVIKKGRNKTYDKQIIKACLKVLKSGFHF